MKGFELKVADKKKCGVILEKHGYRKSISGDIYIKEIEYDADSFMEQIVYVNDIIVFTVGKAEEEVEVENDVLLEMLSRKAINIITYEKNEPYAEVLNKECKVKQEYLLGEYFAWIVAVPNQKVGKWKKAFLVEFRGLVKPEWAKRNVFEFKGKDTYNHTFGDCVDVFPKAWVSSNEIKEILKYE